MILCCWIKRHHGSLVVERKLQIRSIAFCLLFSKVRKLLLSWASESLIFSSQSAKVGSAVALTHNTTFSPHSKFSFTSCSGPINHDCKNPRPLLSHPSHSSFSVHSWHSFWQRKPEPTLYNISFFFQFQATIIVDLYLEMSHSVPSHWEISLPRPIGWFTKRRRREKMMGKMPNLITYSILFKYT